MHEIILGTRTTSK